MAGRPRKPDELKKWQGTLRKCRVNKNAPQPAELRGESEEVENGIGRIGGMDKNGGRGGRNNEEGVGGISGGSKRGNSGGEAGAVFELTEEAQKHYKRIVKLLGRNKILRETDRDWISLYADLISKAAAASKKLEADGYVVETAKGELTPSPYTPIYFKAVERAMKCLQSCGMTPADRSRIVIKELEDEEDLFREIDAEISAYRKSEALRSKRR